MASVTNPRKVETRLVKLAIHIAPRMQHMGRLDRSRRLDILPMLSKVFIAVGVCKYLGRSSPHAVELLCNFLK